MEIVQVSDYDADFRYRVEDCREYCADKIYGDHYQDAIIPTNFENIHLRVIKTGERGFYVAIEDIDNCIVGAVELITRNYKSFGRVLEPHSFIEKEYRGRGYVESVYRWLLDNGFRLVSGDRQTACSNGLWKKLSADYEFNYYNNWEDKVIPVNEMTERTLENSYIRKTLKKVL